MTTDDESYTFAITSALVNLDHASSLQMGQPQIIGTCQQVSAHYFIMHNSNPKQARRRLLSLAVGTCHE